MNRKDKRPTKIYPPHRERPQPDLPNEEQNDEVILPEPPEFPII